MNMDQELDLLYTNRITAGHQGYGMTDEIRRHQFREHMEKKEIILSDPPDQEQVLPDDILRTNPVITDDFQLRDMKKGSVLKERRIVVHVNSGHRNFFEAHDFNAGGATSLNLNATFNATSTDVYYPYYTDTTDGEVKKLLYKDQYPNNYRIPIPIIRNIKSIRLLSTEIPNTIPNINSSNNLLILTIQDGGADVTYDVGGTSFPFITVLLDVGYYQTVESLLEHIESKLNSYAETYVSSPSLPPDLFVITYNSHTGKISISINSAYPTYTFHLRWKFVTDNTGHIALDHYEDLWYKLGFPWPFELDTDGTDLYYREYTNLFDFGSAVPTVDTDYFAINKPYRFPCIDGRSVIFMSLNELQHVENVFHSSVESITGRPYFAKIQMNSDYGTISYNTHIDSPYIYFTNTLDHLDELRISFYDENGALVDFGGVDHSFSLEFVTYIDVLESAHYDVQRGAVDHRSSAETTGLSSALTSSNKNLVNSSI